MNTKVSQSIARKLTLNNYTGSLVLLCLLVLGEIGLLAVTIFPEKKVSQAVQQSEVNQSDLPEEKARSMMVKIISGDLLGSGIIIAKQGKKYRVLTNNHILNTQTKESEIRTADDTVYQGKVVASAADFAGNDLALLDFEVQKKNYPVAKFGKTPKTGDEVFFAGFSPSESGEENQAWVFQKGSIWKILDQPLKEGYQIGYTHEIDKAIKGGVLLNQNGEVIAISRMPVSPQSENPYIYEDGTVVDQALTEEMKRHNFGIPNDSIPPWVFSLSNDQNAKAKSPKPNFGSIDID